MKMPSAAASGEMMANTPLKKRRMNCITHIPFEGPQATAYFGASGGHEVRMTKLLGGDPVPVPDDVDILVALGGPMSVHDEDRYAWLAEEKALVSEYLSTGRCRPTGQRRKNRGEGLTSTQMRI
jgi:hypothetical protein